MTTGRVLVVDDESDIRSLIQEILTDEGYEVQVAADGAEARARYTEQRPDMVLLDIWMPDVDGITLLQEWSESKHDLCPVVIMSGHGTVETAIEATRLGAVDYIEKPLSLAQLLRTTEATLKQTKPVQKPGFISVSAEGPVGKSEAMELLREQTKILAGHDAPLLISGNGGSGRKDCAEYIHSQGARSNGLFQAVSGGTLTDAAAEQRLAGVQTDAGVEQGLFDACNGGTLFIADIHKMDSEAQKFLAAVLQQGFFNRPGSSIPVHLEARVIASTVPDESAGLSSGLLSAVGVLKLSVPALVEYCEDVPELLRFYVEKLVTAEALAFRHFGFAAQNRLRNYPWPGNVLELKRLVRQLLLSGGAEEIGLGELERLLESSTAETGSLVTSDMLSMPLREAREAFEKEYLVQQLSLSGGKVGKLAERVGMERTHLYRKLRSLGVNFRQLGKDDQ
jgi:two-component system nitrogen regulation response regulator NtrX